MNTMERLLESPEEWEVPLAHNQVEQQDTGQLDSSPSSTCLFTRLEESSLVPAGFLTAQFLQKT